MLECPKCKGPIGTESGTGVDQATCPQCRYQYLFWTGKLSKRYSKQLTIQRKTTRQPGSYRREYEFRLDLPSGATETFDLQTGGKQDRIPIRRGDTASFVFTGREGAREDLVQIRNLTRGDTYVTFSPGSKAAANAGCLALLATIVVGIALWGYDLPGTSIAIASFATLVFSYLLLGRVFTPQVAKESVAARSAHRSHGYLQRKRDLKSLQDEHIRSRNESQRQLANLESLLLKMESVGRDAYGTRMDGVRAGVRLLARSIGLDSQLIDEYGKAITIVEIDYESHELESTEMDRSSEVLETKLALVEQLRREYSEVRVQLEAAEELERYLR